MQTPIWGMQLSELRQVPDFYCLFPKVNLGAEFFSAASPAMSQTCDNFAGNKALNAGRQRNKLLKTCYESVT